MGRDLGGLPPTKARGSAQRRRGWRGSFDGECMWGGGRGMGQESPSHGGCV